MLKKKKIYPAYVSSHKSSDEKQVILFMVPNKKKKMKISPKEDGIISIIKKNYF